MLEAAGECQHSCRPAFVTRVALSASAFRKWGRREPPTGAEYAMERSGGEGVVLAILAMLTRQGRGALRVAPGGCARPSPSAPLHGLLFARSGQESRPADRTGKLDLGQGCLDHRVPLGVERHGAHRRPVPGLAAPAAQGNRSNDSSGLFEQALQVIPVPPCLFAAIFKAGDWLCPHEEVEGGMIDDRHVCGSVIRAQSCQVVMENDFKCSRLPSFQIAPKVSANTGCSASMAANVSINGISRWSGIVGIRS